MWHPLLLRTRKEGGMHPTYPVDLVMGIPCLLGVDVAFTISSTARVAMPPSPWEEDSCSHSLHIQLYTYIYIYIIYKYIHMYINIYGEMGWHPIPLNLVMVRNPHSFSIGAGHPNLF